MLVTAGMPSVEVPPDLDERFAKARLVASGKKPANPVADPGGERCVVVVTPSRTFAILHSPRANSMPPRAVEALEKIAPSIRPLNVAVIAYLQFDPLLEKQSKAVPIMGLIIGLSYIGHSVIVFEGHPSALEAGCRDADMVVVDEALIPYLQRDWEGVARSAMRGADLLVCGTSGALKRIPNPSR